MSDKCRRRVLVTGTPLQNNLQELQALLELILPEVAGHVAEAAAGDDDDDAVRGDAQCGQTAVEWVASVLAWHGCLHGEDAHPPCLFTCCSSVQCC